MTVLWRGVVLTGVDAMVCSTILLLIQNKMIIWENDDEVRAINYDIPSIRPRERRALNAK
jgi:hypothetical protein